MCSDCFLFRNNAHVYHWLNLILNSGKPIVHVHVLQKTFMIVFDSVCKLVLFELSCLSVSNSTIS